MSLVQKRTVDEDTEDSAIVPVVKRARNELLPVAEGLRDRQLAAAVGTSPDWFG
jgi:hypothetical protein